MEQKPKRMGGAEIIDFEKRKTEHHKESVLRKVAETLKMLQDEILNSASEAAEYGDPLTHHAFDDLDAAQKKCIDESAEPGTPVFKALEETLTGILHKRDVLRRTHDMLKLLEEEMGKTKSEEDRRAGQRAVDMLHTAYEKAVVDDTYNEMGLRELEKTLNDLHNIMFPSSGNGHRDTIVPLIKKQ